jgi:Protein of unknown function (DUF1553)
VFPDNTTTEIPWGTDPRTVFADWLVDNQNSMFARAICNRVWCWLHGRGIIDPANDIRADVVPVNPELLDYLVDELVESNHDLRHLYRLILNSSTWQLSWAADRWIAEHLGAYPSNTEVSWSVVARSRRSHSRSHGRVTGCGSTRAVISTSSCRLRRPEYTQGNCEWKSTERHRD